MATVTAYKALAADYTAAQGTFAEVPAVGADKATAFVVGGPYTVNIATETVRGVVHPGIEAVGDGGLARNRWNGGGGHFAEITFDSITDVVERLNDGMATYRLSACTVTAIDPPLP